MPLTTPAHQRGFTLVEVLVSALLLGLSLVGLAGLQSLILANNQNAYMLSQATLLTTDLTDRMRANRDNNGLADAYLSSNLKPEDAKQQSSCATTSGCTPAQMAEHDLYEWQLALSTTLPNGQAVVGKATGNTYTISITWDDDRDGDTDNNANFQTEFRL
ncbi:MAG: type IV pilus modification protein PilV [Methylococcales bacterium]|nr:type IV pilus modification protein PilV [Methylococcales bacterium]